MECPQGTPLKSGARVRLQHVNTRAWLHSHHFPSPLTQSQEARPNLRAPACGRFKPYQWSGMYVYKCAIRLVLAPVLLALPACARLLQDRVANHCLWKCSCSTATNLKTCTCTFNKCGETSPGLKLAGCHWSAGERVWGRGGERPPGRVGGQLGQGRRPALAARQEGAARSALESTCIGLWSLFAVPSGCNVVAVPSHALLGRLLAVLSWEALARRRNGFACVS